MSQTSNKYLRGSEWRRWDLHIHTPETKLSDSYNGFDDVWEEYIKRIEVSPVSVFGITDYFSADTYYKAPSKNLLHFG